MRIFRLINVGKNQKINLDNIQEYPFIPLVTGATNGQILTFNNNSWVASTVNIPVSSIETFGTTLYSTNPPTKVDPTDNGCPL